MTLKERSKKWLNAIMKAAKRLENFLRNLLKKLEKLTLRIRLGAEVLYSNNKDLEDHSEEDLKTNNKNEKRGN